MNHFNALFLTHIAPSYFIRSAASPIERDLPETKRAASVVEDGDAITHETRLPVLQNCSQSLGLPF